MFARASVYLLWVRAAVNIFKSKADMIPVTDTAVEQGVGLSYRGHVLPCQAIDIDCPFSSVLPHWQVDFARIKQVRNCLVVDLKVGAANLELKTACTKCICCRMFLCDSVEQVFKDSRNQPSVLTASILDFCFWTLHGIGLSTARLTVSEYRSVIPAS